MKKIVNIRVDEELWQRAKVRAAQENKTLQSYLEAALKDALEKQNGLQPGSRK